MTTTTTGLTLDDALNELANWGEQSQQELRDALEDLVRRTSVEQVAGYELDGPHVTVLYSGGYQVALDANGDPVHDGVPGRTAAELATAGVAGRDS